MPLITTTITPFTKTPSRQNPSTFSADMDDRLSEENSRITQMNNLGEEMNDVADLINAQSTSINTVSTNIAAVNTVSTNIAKVSTVSTNIAKVQNLDTNMTKIANLDTNMTKIANVDNNMTKVQNLDTNMTKISTVSTNIASVNTVSTDIANVNIVANNIGSITTKVSLTGDETIAGVKTFSSSPIVPTSTTSTQAVNKGQLDLKSNIASPTFTGTVVLPSTTSIGNVSNTEIGYLDGVTSAIQTQLGTKAPLASPALTGTPTTPTASVTKSTTQIASTAFATPRTATTGASVIPAGTTAQRPASPSNGYLRYNTELLSMEGYINGAWGSVGGGATGGGTNKVFFENDLIVSSNYTITSGKSAVSAGDITINSGITVTVPSGSRWSIV